jgi:hypothetical protein
VVFRRDALLAALDRVGDELYEYKVAGDWRLYIDLCATNLKVVFEAEPLNGHRRHQSSVTHTLEAQNHLKEIEGMHRLVNEKLSSQLIKDNQMKYLQHVAQYLNQS